MTDKIDEVKFTDDYLILILLRDGYRLIYDMKPKLVTARFRDLADRKLFSEGILVHSSKTIKWNENTEISIEEILFQAEAV